MKSLAATLTGLSVLLIGGGFMASQVLAQLPDLGFQSAILAVILASLSTLLTPISSAFGGATIIPPSSAQHFLGAGPVIVWLLSGAIMGLVTQRARDSVIPALVTSSMTYLLVLGLAGYVLPRVPEAIRWEVYLTRLAQQIILEGPLDFVFLFVFPLVSAIVASGLLELVASKPPARQDLAPRRRFWEIPEEK